MRAVRAGARPRASWGLSPVVCPRRKTTCSELECESSDVARFRRSGACASRFLCLWTGPPAVKRSFDCFQKRPRRWRASAHRRRWGAAMRALLRPHGDPWKVRHGSGSAPCRVERERRTGVPADCEPRSVGDPLCLSGEPSPAKPIARMAMHETPLPHSNSEQVVLRRGRPPD